MANEQQYINPIIQSMIHVQQVNQERARLQQQADEFKQTNAIRQHQLQLEEKRADREAEHQAGMLNVQKMLAEAQVEANRLGRVKQTFDLLHQGYNPIDINKALASVGGQQVQGMPNPEDLLKFEAARTQKLAGAQITGQRAAAEPFDISAEERAMTNKEQLMNFEFNFKRRLDEFENQFKAAESTKKLASEEKIAGLSRATQLAIANATNATHLKVAGMQYTPTPENLRAMFIAGATGAAKLNYANPQERAALGEIHTLGGREVDPKDLQALKEGQQLMPLFKQLEDFANQLPSTSGGAMVQGKKLAIQNWAGWPSKTQTDLNNIMAQALNIARAVEGMTGGRVLSKQLELDLNSLASGGIRKEDALSRLKNLEDLYINKQENTIMGGMPDWQKELIYHKYGIRPSFLVGAPNENKAGHKLDLEESIKLGKPAYAGN